MTDYKLMPKQITKEMADAFWEEYSKDRADDLLMRCYRALYVTAPAPQPAPDAADYEQVLDDHRRLTRELDVLLNGEEGAAQQASMADLVAQLRIVVRNTGKPVLATPDVAGLVEALGRALDFIRGDGDFEHREALERCECYACVTDEIIDSLAAHRKKGGEA